MAYGALIEDLKIKTNSLYFYPIFLIRRLFYVFQIVILYDYPVLQLGLITTTTLLPMLFYLIFVMPFEKTFDNVINILNEAILTFCFISALIMNTFEISDSMIKAWGWLMVGLILTSLLITWVLIMPSVVRQAFNTLVECFWGVEKKGKMQEMTEIDKSSTTTNAAIKATETENNRDGYVKNEEVKDTSEIQLENNQTIINSERTVHPIKDREITQEPINEPENVQNLDCDINNKSEIEQEKIESDGNNQEYSEKSVSIKNMQNQEKSEIIQNIDPLKVSELLKEPEQINDPKLSEIIQSDNQKYSLPNEENIKTQMLESDIPQTFRKQDSVAEPFVNKNTSLEPVTTPKHETSVAIKQNNEHAANRLIKIESQNIIINELPTKSVPTQELPKEELKFLEHVSAKLKILPKEGNSGKIIRKIRKGHEAALHKKKRISDNDYQEISDQLKNYSKHQRKINRNIAKNLEEIKLEGANLQNEAKGLYEKMDVKTEKYVQEVNTEKMKTEFARLDNNKANE